MRTKIIIGIILSTLIVGRAQENFIKDSLDVFISREMPKWQLPGMAIVVVKNGEIVLMKGYGFSDRDKKIPVSEKTVFQIASNSKAFTGTALALLESYGKLNLKDPVKKYLPYFQMKEPYLTENVTIEDALSHRIGYGTFQSDLLNWGSTCSRKELIQNMKNVTPQYGFREKYGYCNVGFLTAGEIIPAVCDTSWDDYLNFHFFKPLGMGNTTTRFSEFAKNANASKAYGLVKGKLEQINPANIDNLGPAASVTSSVEDLSKWVIMQLAGGKYDGKTVIASRVIKRTRQALNITGQGKGKNNLFNAYGLGWFLKDENGKLVVTHDGGANGFLSKTVIIPDANAGFVILTNSDAQWFYEALGEILTKNLTGQPFYDYNGLYLTEFNNRQKRDADSVKKWAGDADKFAAGPEQYKKAEGVYEHPVYGKLAVKATAKGLEIYFQHHPAYKGMARFIDKERLYCEFNEYIAGTEKLRYYTEGAKEILDIKVNDFVDMDHYLFVKTDKVFKPFVK